MNDIIDDIDFDRYGKVKCSKIEGDVAEADEDGGRGDEEYEINSMGEPSGIGTTRNGRDGIATERAKKRTQQRTAENAG